MVQLGKCGKCDAFSISCFKDSNLPVYIEIVAESIRCTIIEGEQGKAVTSD